MCVSVQISEDAPRKLFVMLSSHVINTMHVLSEAVTHKVRSDSFAIIPFIHAVHCNIYILYLFLLVFTNYVKICINCVLILWNFLLLIV